MSSEKEHQFVCSNEHPTETVILLSRIGTAPDAPACPKCGVTMKKVWTKPDISYATHWHWAQRNLE